MGWLPFPMSMIGKGAAGGSSFSTLNGSDKATTLTLSGDNLTASVTDSGGSGTEGGARGTLGRNTGKFYFEFTLSLVADQSFSSLEQLRLQPISVALTIPLYPIQDTLHALL